MGSAWQTGTPTAKGQLRTSNRWPRASSLQRLQTGLCRVETLLYVCSRFRSPQPFVAGFGKVDTVSGEYSGGVLASLRIAYQERNFNQLCGITPAVSCDRPAGAGHAFCPCTTVQRSRPKPSAQPPTSVGCALVCLACKSRKARPCRTV